MINELKNKIKDFSDMERFYGDIIWWNENSREVSVTYKHTGFFRNWRELFRKQMQLHFMY